MNHLSIIDPNRRRDDPNTNGASKTPWGLLTLNSQGLSASQLTEEDYFTDLGSATSYFIYSVRVIVFCSHFKWITLIPSPQLLSSLKTLCTCVLEATFNHFFLSSKSETFSAPEHVTLFVFMQSIHKLVWEQSTCPESSAVSCHEVFDSQTLLWLSVFMSYVSVKQQQKKKALAVRGLGTYFPQCFSCVKKIYFMYSVMKYEQVN